MLTETINRAVEYSAQHTEQVTCKKNEAVKAALSKVHLIWDDKKEPATEGKYPRQRGSKHKTLEQQQDFVSEE